MPSHGVSSRSLMKAHRQVGSQTTKMVTGKRINTASDDAANAGVASNLSAQKMGTRMALRNIADGMSLLSTTEEAVNQVSEKIMRMRELAIQGSSEILEDPERRYLQKEFQSLKDSMDDLAAKTEFNGIALADGSNVNLAVQIGANNSADDRLGVVLQSLTTASVFGGNLIGVKRVSDSQASIAFLDEGLDYLNQYRSKLGSNQNVLSTASRSAEFYAQHMETAASRVEDADYAHQAAQLARAQMILQASTAVRAQAKIADQAVLGLIRG